MIAECKADNTDHEKACAEAVGYAQCLAGKYDVIIAGVSGTTSDTLKIQTAIIRKDGSVILTKENPNFNDSKILSLQDYDRFIGYTDRAEKDFKDKLDKIKDKINWILYEVGDLVPDKRMLVVSACLIGLRDPAFRNSYVNYKTDRVLSYLISSVDSVLKDYGIPDSKRVTIIDNFNALKQIDVLVNGLYNTDGEFLDPIHQILDTIHGSSIHELFEGSVINIDIMGEFFNEFITHKKGKEQATNGFVLTPRHICELFADLAELDENTKMLDMCFGTGGFLVAGMQKELLAARGDESKINNIKYNNICGVELNGDRFTYGCVNMILRGDGQSNMIQGNCFNEQIKREMKEKHCTVGFINPPYALPTNELKFVENMLDCLEPGGRGIAIIPSSCAGNRNSDYRTTRERILSKHTLEAVLSMPDQLFYPAASTVTCVMVFTAGRPHNSERKTWFANCKDDGLVIDRKNGRADINHKWHDIKSKWVNAFIDRDEIQGFSLKQAVTAADEWSYEAYAKADFSGITEESFKKVIKEYALFMLSQAEV